jgi:hypothetical protein
VSGMRAPRRTLVVALAAALLCLGTTMVGTAGAAHVACGQTLTANTTFDADVGPCDQGIVIGADNIVVDLAGHTLRGPTRPELDEPGIDTDRHRGVIIRNGTVTGFSAGIAVRGGSGNSITDMVVRDNLGSPSSEGDYGDGIVLFDSNNNRITRTRVIHNGTYNGIGLVNSNRNLIEYNLILDNNVPLLDRVTHQPRGTRDMGIWVLSLAPGLTADGNIIRSNQVLRSGADGIRIAGFTFDNVVQTNIVAQSGLGIPPIFGEGDGIAVIGNRTQVLGNTTSQNGHDGIAVLYLEGAPGFVTGQGNVVRNNNSSRNNLRPRSTPGFDLTDTNPACNTNVWSANRFVTFSHPCVTAP